MRQVLEFANEHDALQLLEPAFVDVLLRSPVYFRDARIRELIAPMSRSLLAGLSEADPQKFTSISLALMAPAFAEPGDAVNQYIRQNTTSINKLLFKVERDPQNYTAETLAKAQLLRERLNMLPEIKSISGMLRSLDFEYQRSDGQTVEMPFYFEFNKEGAIAALNAEQFDKVSRQSSHTKLVEDTIFFVPPNLRFGAAGAQYYNVDNSDYVYLTAAHINDFSTPLLRSFHLLGEAYKASMPSPALAVSDLLFAGDDTLHEWISDAYKGIPRRLSENQITYLEEQFGQSAAGLFQNFDHANNPVRWPESGIAPHFEQNLRSLAQSQGVAADDIKGFAHFLFAQSAALTRLSSEKIFGNGDDSIPALRFAGYVLFARSRQLAPELLAADQWQDMENRFLKLNNAFDCAEILSRQQFSASKSVNPAEFEIFTPHVFKSQA